MNKPESILQAKCFKWFWNNHHEYRGMLCYNLNNSRNKIEGARNKQMGLIEGRADMTLYLNKTAYFFEFKTPYSGVQSKEQNTWQTTVEKAGYKYYVIARLEEFQRIIKQIIEV